MEVPKTWFKQMRNTLIMDKGKSENLRTEEECAKKTFLQYIQEWLSTASVKEMAHTTTGESEEMKDRKSYLQKTKEMMFDLR